MKQIIVIGGGAAGIAGAMMAAAAKKKVAIIEKDLIGGGNTLCAFSQLMAGKISQLLCQAREGSSVGLNSDQLKINLPYCIFLPPQQFYDRDQIV